MDKKIKNGRKIFFRLLPVFALLVAKFLDADVLAFPLIALCACDCDCSCDGGSGDCSGTCGCGNGGAGCAGADCGGGGGGGGIASTPFLCTWNGTRFQFENDILFGKPSSLFQTKEAGQYAYEHGYITGDMYKIQNAFVPKEGRLAFQIKEVEPEESFIDHVSLLHVAYPKHGELVVNSNLQDFLVFDKNDLEKRHGMVVQTVLDKNQQDVHEVIAQEGLYAMETDDALEVRGKVESIDTPLYLLLGSHYRDWTLGGIFQEDGTALVKSRIYTTISDTQSIGSFLVASAKVFGLVILLGAVWVFGSFQNILARNNQESFTNQGALATAFGVQGARADVPWWRSLVVEYLDGGTFHTVDVIQPRYYQKTMETVQIPLQAIGKDGEVFLRIRATKKHHVTDVFLVAPKKLLSFTTDTLKVTKALHQRTKRDYAQELNQKNSKEYLHTIPADIVDIEFESVKNSDQYRDQNETYLIQAFGYYTPASRETQKIAGDWVSKLEPESKKWLEEMYAFSDYDKKDRKTIL